MTDNKIEDIFDPLEGQAEQKKPVAVKQEESKQIETQADVRGSFSPSTKHMLNKVIVVLVMVIVLVIVYFFFTKVVFDESVDVVDGGESEEIETPVEIEAFEKKEDPEITDVFVEDDEDQDGLEREYELKIGTNPLKADSDSDGLYDYDEDKFYHTDPLDPDTDGDGYLDGEEVLGGYNPKGAGQLLNFKKAISEFDNN